MPRKHRIIAGECLSSIASAYGIRDWKAIYDHADNRAFKEARPDPNVVLPGDVILIPDLDREIKMVPVSTSSHHRFKVTLSKALVRIAVKDENERPLVCRKYEFEVQDVVHPGVTDSLGI